MIENALAAGFLSVGMDVNFLGPVPTPAVGMLTRSLRADMGVMISASHNPFEDNGIKLFGPDGFKLSDEDEAAIEARMDGAPELAEPAEIGSATRLEDGRGRYIEFAKTSFPRRQQLSGLKIVVDCANGAAYRTAPQVLWELGADVVRLGTSPDGENINLGCGSTDPALCQKTVVDEGADLGIALDGDADRVHIIDETRPGRRRRPDHGADRDALGGGGQAGRQHAGRDGHVEPGPRAGAGRAGHRAAAHPGRRPLRRRGDARRRLQPRRRAVGPHHPGRPCDDRRRAAGGAAGAGGAGRGRQAGIRALPDVRAGAAASEERALQPGGAAAGGRHACARRSRPARRA